MLHFCLYSNIAKEDVDALESYRSCNRPQILSCRPVSLMRYLACLITLVVCKKAKSTLKEKPLKIESKVEKKYFKKRQPTMQ